MAAAAEEDVLSPNETKTSDTIDVPAEGIWGESCCSSGLLTGCDSDRQERTLLHVCSLWRHSQYTGERGLEVKQEEEQTKRSLSAKLMEERWKTMFKKMRKVERKNDRGEECKDRENRMIEIHRGS